MKVPSVLSLSVMESLKKKQTKCIRHRVKHKDEWSEQELVAKPTQERANQCTAVSEVALVVASQ